MASLLLLIEAYIHIYIQYIPLVGVAVFSHYVIIHPNSHKHHYSRYAKRYYTVPPLVNSLDCLNIAYVHKPANLDEWLKLVQTHNRNTQ